MQDPTIALGLSAVVLSVIITTTECGLFGTVRLVNGSYSNEGRVEVYDSGEWHNVCQYQWGFHTADVICRELGYKYAIFHGDAEVFGEGSRSMLSIPIVCGGTESTLNECRFVRSEVCSHSRDVGIKCSSESLQHGSLRLDPDIFYKSYPCGSIEVYYNGRWGGVCDKQETWDDTASDVACKQMGYDGVHETLGEGLHDRNKAVMSAVYCTGREGRLVDCRHSTEVSGCTSSYGPWPEAMKVCCYYRTFTITFILKIALFLFIGVPVLKRVMKYCCAGIAAWCAGIIADMQRSYDDCWKSVVESCTKIFKYLEEEERKRKQQVQAYQRNVASRRRVVRHVRETWEYVD